MAYTAEACIRPAITDLRSAPAEVEIEFTGTLRAEQQVAVDAVAPYELGVLVAPPGAGKTVMGCGLIALHKVPTLILVDLDSAGGPMEGAAA